MRAIILLGSVWVGLLCAACAAPTLEDKRTLMLGGRREALAEDGPPRRVFLITVAGLDAADYLDPWGRVAADGDPVLMPELATLAREGAVGIRAIPPSPGATYTAHATIATGKRPKRHGITSNELLDDDGGRSTPYWDNRMLEGTALWDAAIGRGVISLGWPTTVGARIELVLPEATANEPQLSWLDRLAKVSNPYLIRELEEMWQLAFERSLQQRDPRTWPTPAEKDAAYAELVCRISETDRDPGLWLIRFDQTQAIEQVSGPGSIDVSEGLRRTDRAIGRIVECLAKSERLGDTAIIVSGDVAYRPVHTRVDPNVTLVRAGMIGRDPRSTTGVRSWLALVRSSGRSAFVYARDAADAVKARDLLAFEGERTGAFEVVPASELAEAGADPQAWFGLSARPGFVIGNGMVPPILRPSEVRGAAGALGSREPEESGVGFVAWGRGIRPQVRMPDLELIDIAPTVAELLGLRLDEEIDGEPMIGLLRASRPPPPVGPRRIGVGQDGDIDRAIRDLGGGGRREVGEDD